MTSAFIEGNPENLIESIEKLLTELTDKVYTDQPISFGDLQRNINYLFYNQGVKPVEKIYTLGRGDPFLAQAAARDFMKRDSKVAFEVGPGNFFFARAFIDELSKEGKEHFYHAYDYSEAAHAYLTEILEEYKDSLKFVHQPLEGFMNISNSSVDGFFVELLDDTLTEFFTYVNGEEHIMTAHPYERRHKDKKARGNHDAAIGMSVDRIMEQMNSGDWKPLVRLNRDVSAMNWDVSHKTKTIEEMLKERGISFGQEQDQIIKFYRSQIQRLPEKAVVSIPLEGIQLLYALKDKERVNLDFFDYGYTSTENITSATQEYAGQITAPVNFELLEHAAQCYGYDTTLEKIGTYTEKHMGVDTVSVMYMHKVVTNPFVWSKPDREMAYGFFSKPANLIYPDHEVTVDNIEQLRVPRKFFNVWLDIMREREVIPKNYDFDDQSYHLSVKKEK